MKTLPNLPSLVILSTLLLPSAEAHFPILIHDANLGAANGPVTVIFASGHPFELELEPAELPERLWWMDRRGRATDLTSVLEKTLFRGDTNGIAWQCAFEPPPGDLLLALNSAASRDARQQTVYREYVKVWLPRGRQENWHQRTGQPLEIVPLTRPYGLRPGMVFTGQLMRDDRPVADTEIYAERLSDAKPDAASLPPDPLLTFAVRTDGDGRFALTLPDPGWWVLGGYADDLGTELRDGQSWRLEGFAGAWLHVEAR